MWACVHEHQRIHFETQGDIIASGLCGFIQRNIASVIRHHFTEPVDISRHIRATQTVFGEFYQKCIVTILQPLIAILLIVSFPPTCGNLIGIAIAANSVMPTTIGIFGMLINNRRKNAAHIRIQTIAFLQFECVLAFECVGCVIAFQQIAWVVKQHCQIGAAFYIGNFH